MARLGLHLEEVGGHHGGQGTGDQQREEHREGDRQAEALEELANVPGHERHGQEHAHDGKGRRGDRELDFTGRVDRGLDRILARLHVAEDVLQVHDRVVDQDTDHQREGHHGDVVEGEA
ncbi:hypothetical protein D3C86_1226850 [compost metagenome]